MKYILVILCLILTETCYTQCTDFNHETHKLRIVSKNGSISNDTILAKVIRKELKTTFLKHKVKKIKPAFPFSKNEILKRVYNIEFDGDIIDLEKDLKAKHLSEIQQCDRIPLREKVQLFDPNDDHWDYLRPDGLLASWPLHKIQADKAWDITKGSWYTKIAILDTWFDINHPDLQGKLNPLFDPYDGTAFSTDCTRSDHGTTVAVNAAGLTDEGNKNGKMSSIGFKCRIIPYQGHDGDYVERAYHASFVMGADVITSSAGLWRIGPNLCIGLDNIEKIAVKEILDNGTIIVMPAGNGDFGFHCSPTGGRSHDWPLPQLTPLYDERVIVVTSTNSEDKHTHVKTDGTTITASHFPEVDICAPSYNTMRARGTELELADGTCDPQWPYIWSDESGTSQAAPIVAGVCGLMKTINWQITPDQAQSIIKVTADPVADAHLFPGLIGAGRINAYCSVYLAKQYEWLHNWEFTGTNTYTKYLTYLNDIIVSSGSLNINSAEILITKSIDIKKGATFSMQNPDNWNLCPE